MESKEQNKWKWKKKTDTKNRLIVDKGEGDGKLGEKGEVIKQ